MNFIVYISYLALSLIVYYDVDLYNICTGKFRGLSSRGAKGDHASYESKQLDLVNFCSVEKTLMGGIGRGRQS